MNKTVFIAGIALIIVGVAFLGFAQTHNPNYQLKKYYNFNAANITEMVNGLYVTGPFQENYSTVMIFNGPYVNDSALIPISDLHKINSSNYLSYGIKPSQSSLEQEEYNDLPAGNYTLVSIHSPPKLYSIFPYSSDHIFSLTTDIAETLLFVGFVLLVIGFIIRGKRNKLPPL